jgi:hypothetical protein
MPCFRGAYGHDMRCGDWPHALVPDAVTCLNNLLRRAEAVSPLKINLVDESSKDSAELHNSGIKRSTLRWLTQDRGEGQKITTRNYINVKAGVKETKRRLGPIQRQELSPHPRITVCAKFCAYTCICVGFETM